MDTGMGRHLGSFLQSTYASLTSDTKSCNKICKTLKCYLTNNLFFKQMSRFFKLESSRQKSKQLYSLSPVSSISQGWCLFFFKEKMFLKMYHYNQPTHMIYYTHFFLPNCFICLVLGQLLAMLQLLVVWMYLTSQKCVG